VPSEPVSDALPRFFDASEVDEPAAPAAPIRPVYPPLALSRGLEGDVTFRVAVRADGVVAGLRRLASDGPDFTRAAEAAVRAARFTPARRGGEPVNSTFLLRVRFRLHE
jgi:protein TonB